MITVAQLHELAPKCDAAILAPALSSAATEFSIDTPLRLAHWLAQYHVESMGFTRFEENLNYSAKRLCQVWPRRFPTLADAVPYANNPTALGAKAYNGRMGNTAPGDGWRYRGRGAGLTGKDNYQKFGDMLDLDLVDHPELAADPAIAARLAGAFWHSHNLNPVADRDDVAAVTETWNGGLTGLSDRKAALAVAKRILAA